MSHVLLSLLIKVLCPISKLCFTRVFLRLLFISHIFEYIQINSKCLVPYNHFSLLDFTGSLEVRLSNGKSECSGRVEVRHGEVWQTVCDTDWTLSKAEVVCQQLECGHAVTAPSGAHFGQGSGSVVEASDSCFDNVTSLQQCSVTGFRSSRCGHEHDASALCAGKSFSIMC